MYMKKLNPRAGLMTGTPKNGNPYTPMKLMGESNPKMQEDATGCETRYEREEGPSSQIDVSQIGHEIARGKTNRICESTENKQKTTPSNTGHEVVVSREERMNRRGIRTKENR